MARVYTKGLAYFPMAVGYFRDPKLRDLILDYQELGEVIYFRVLDMVYQEGYYIEMNVDGFAKAIYFSMHFRSQDVTHELIKEILLRMGEIGLLDREMLKIGIITSKGIQKQFYSSTIRRKEKDHEYWLLTRQEEAKLRVTLKCKPCPTSSDEVDNNSNENVNKNVENVNNSDEFVSNFYQRKSKKEKEIEKYDKFDKNVFAKYDRILENKMNIEYPNKLHYYTKCLIKDETISLYDSHIEDYNELFEDILSAYDFKLVASCMKYIRAYVKNPTEPIQDMFPFIKFSLTHNIDRLSKTEEASTEWRERFDEFFKRFHKSD